MGRTVPSFRLAQMREEQEWKEFRRALSKSERKAFDDMLATSRLYISACSYASKPIPVQPIPVQPILMSIIFHHYKRLDEIKRAIEGSDQ